MNLENVEAKHLELRQNIEKLQKTIQHWQTWEAEYEALKEELVTLPDHASREQITTLGGEFGGDLVNRKEIEELFGLDKHSPRSRDQVTGLVSRRIDYVRQNLASAHKQLEAAETISDAAIYKNTAMPGQEADLPLTEIIEELDEDGNVTASHTSVPGKSHDELLAALKKTGVEPGDLSEGSNTPAKDDIASDGLSLNESTPDQTEDPPKPKGSESNPRDTSDSSSLPRKKSVSFATGTKDETEGPDPEGNVLRNRPTIAELAKGSFGKDERVWELGDDDKPVDFTSPHIPKNESPEDAALRRQMLQYRLNEINNVVAEIDLQDSGSDDDMSDDDDLLEADSASDDEDEDEDEHGLSTANVISSKYRKEMAALEKKLNAQMIENTGPAQSTAPNDGNPPAKNVRFAESIDISPSQASTAASGTDWTTPTPDTAPIKDQIVERKAPSSTTSKTQQPPKKVSRFKSNRTALGHTGLDEPIKSNAPLAADVVERPPQHATTMPREPPTEPDEYDPDVLKKELAREYHDQRSKLIRRQGGFTAQDPEDENGMVVEEPEPRPGAKKVSLFKSARVNGNQAWK